MVRHSTAPAASSNIVDGIRPALALAPPTLALGVSFGVLAKPVMGSVAPIVMSALLFSGGAQFAALSVLAVGGGTAAAVIAATLMQARWLPMSLAIATSLQGRLPRRVLQAQAIVDASFLLASRGDGTFDRGQLIGATILQASAWIIGTALGVFSSGLIHNPDKLGLDGIFPAFYLTLFAAELRRTHGREVLVTGAVAAVITLFLMPFTAGGVPVIAGSCAALCGLRR